MLGFLISASSFLISALAFSQGTGKVESACPRLAVNQWAPMGLLTVTNPNGLKVEVETEEDLYNNHSLVAWLGQEFLVVSAGALERSWMYDPCKDVWRKSGFPQLGPNRVQNLQATINDWGTWVYGTVLVWSGEASSPQTVVYKLETDRQSWKSVDQSKVACANLLPAKKGFFCWGRGEESPSVQMFSFTDEKWHPLPPMQNTKSAQPSEFCGLAGEDSLILWNTRRLELWTEKAKKWQNIVHYTKPAIGCRSLPVANGHLGWTYSSFGSVQDLFQVDAAPFEVKALPAWPELDDSELAQVKAPLDQIYVLIYSQDGLILQRVWTWIEERWQELTFPKLKNSKATRYQFKNLIVNDTGIYLIADRIGKKETVTSAFRLKKNSASKGKATPRKFRTTWLTSPVPKGDAPKKSMPIPPQEGLLFSGGDYLMSLGRVEKRQGNDCHNPFQNQIQDPKQPVCTPSRNVEYVRVLPGGWVLRTK